MHRFLKATIGIVAFALALVAATVYLFLLAMQGTPYRQVVVDNRTGRLLAVDRYPTGSFDERSVTLVLAHKRRQIDHAPGNRVGGAYRFWDAKSKKLFVLRFVSDDDIDALKPEEALVLRYSR